MAMLRKTRWLCVALVAITFVAAKSADKSHKVTIKHLKYDPPAMTVKPGETVVWTNEDDNDHTVISDDMDKKKPLFASDNLGNGDKYSHTFDQKGEFAYHCKYHPRMKGKITVAD